MLVSICGTPGTGKTTVCGVLKRHHFDIIELKTLVEDRGWHDGYDDRSGSFIVDVDDLRSRLDSWWTDERGDTIIEGHLSYLAPSDMVLVLRTDPNVILDRLINRGYDRSKSMENAEAEGVSSVLSEAMDEETIRLAGIEWEGLPSGRGIVLERDVTRDTPEMTAEWIMDMMKSFRGKELKHIYLYRPGNVDWTEVISGWY